MPAKSAKARDPAQIVPIQIRIREDLRARLEASAKVSGRAMNAEIADRLEKSLDNEKHLGGDHLRPLLYVLAYDVARAERTGGARWDESRTVAHACAKLASETFRFGSASENQKEASEAMQRIKDAKKVLAQKVGYLIEVGLIGECEPSEAPYQTNALASVSILNPYYSKPPAEGAVKTPPAEYAPACRYLTETNHRFLIDLHEPFGKWPLFANGKPLSREERVGPKAVLEEFNDFCKKLDPLYQNFAAACEPEEVAKRAGEELAEKLTKANHGR